MDVLVAYGACKKNQNHASTTPVHDGCMEFSSSFKGDRKCEACGCHRSFHERIILVRDQNGTISCASQMVLPEINPLQMLPRSNSKDDRELTLLNPNQSKRRKLDELPAEEAYSEFIAGRSAVVTSAKTTANNGHHPMPLHTLEVEAIEHDKEALRGSWLCGADKEKIFSGIKQQDGEVVAGPDPTPPEKLMQFFERLQKEHPESPLKLEYVDESWRVLCGVCARYLRADKKGESLHNIQKQHFVTPKHISNLQAKMDAPDEMEFWLKRMSKLREKRAQQQARQRFITAA